MPAVRGVAAVTAKRRRRPRKPSLDEVPRPKLDARGLPEVGRVALTPREQIKRAQEKHLRRML